MALASLLEQAVAVVLGPVGMGVVATIEESATIVVAVGRHKEVVQGHPTLSRYSITIIHNEPCRVFQLSRLDRPHQRYRRATISVPTKLWLYLLHQCLLGQRHQ